MHRQYSIRLNTLQEAFPQGVQPLYDSHFADFHFLISLDYTLELIHFDQLISGSMDIVGQFDWISVAYIPLKQLLFRQCWLLERLWYITCSL